MKSEIIKSTLNKSIYFCELEFEKVKKNIFLNSYQFFINPKYYNKKIKFYPTTFLPNLINEPILIINNNNKIIVTSNVCTHRAHILINQACQKKNITCPYHGRQFNNYGELEFIPKFEGKLNKQYNLKKFSSIEWNHFVLINLHKKKLY